MHPIPPAEYTSERLLLRRYRPEDALTYWRMLCENRGHLREFLPANMAAAQNEDDMRAVIEWQIDMWQRGEVFIWGLWEKDGGAYAGEVYLANADWDVPCIEVGYFTERGQGGKGYAVEAARAACRIAFELLGVRRVELQCAADNEKSAAVARHTGFTWRAATASATPKKTARWSIGCGLACCAPSGRRHFAGESAGFATPNSV